MRPMSGGSRDGLSVSVWTDRFPYDTYLDAVLSDDARVLTLRSLLDGLFPGNASERSEVLAGLDCVGNPDLPACYAELFELVGQWREGFCQLSFYTGRGWGSLARADVPIAPRIHGPAFCAGPASGGGDLLLRLAPCYRPLDWGVAAGYVGDLDEWLDWMRACLVLYFVDKCAGRVPSPAALDRGEPCWPVVAGLYQRRLLGLGSDGFSRVTELGQSFIGWLVAETEGLIDRFDLYSDVLWGEGGQPVEFGTGMGDDLRVLALMTEGLDPLRAVFLLQLYDGTPDPWADSWASVVGDVRAFDHLLEPVVNRAFPAPDAGVLSVIIESGQVVLDARAAAEQARVADAGIRARLLTL